MKKILFLIICICSVNMAYAGSETGTVRFNHGQYNSSSTSAGYTFFYLDGSNKINVPGCASYDGGERWVVNNNWPAAQLQMSTLLTAVASGKSVSVRGSNDCNVWGDTETMVDVILIN